MILLTILFHRQISWQQHVYKWIFVSDNESLTSSQNAYFHFWHQSGNSFFHDWETGIIFCLQVMMMCKALYTLVRQDRWYPWKKVCDSRRNAIESSLRTLVSERNDSDQKGSFFQRHDERSSRVSLKNPKGSLLIYLIFNRILIQYVTFMLPDKHQWPVNPCWFLLQYRWGNLKEFLEERSSHSGFDRLDCILCCPESILESLGGLHAGVLLFKKYNERLCSCFTSELLYV